MRRLTNYGKRALNRAIALAALLVMLTGATIMVTENAAWYLLGQKYFNLAYIAVIMPICFAVMAHIAFVEYDKKHRDSISDYRLR